MPKSYKTIAVNLTFSSEEYSKIQYGLIPHQMEDRWFIYFNKGKLYCHRSWTGGCIYIAHFHSKNEKYILTRIDVNNNKGEYRPQSDFYELKNFNYLVELIFEGNSDVKVKPFTKETTLEMFEQELCEYYENLHFQIKDHYKYLLENTRINLRKSNVTKAIILRLKTYYETQNEIVGFLDKKSVSPASDFFVETVVFYLKLLLEQRNKKVSVKSEVRFDIKGTKKYMKPDISIWRGNKVLAIIECKTNLGFARKRWESDFTTRKQQLKLAFPKAKAYLLVLSSKNWPGFDKGDKRVNSEFFALSNTGLRGIKDAPLDDVVENRIETLFSGILKI